MILPCRLSLSLSFVFLTREFPRRFSLSLSFSRYISSFSLSLLHSPLRDRDDALYLSYSVALLTCVYGCSSSFKLCSEMPSSSSSASFSSSCCSSSSRVPFPLLLLRRRLHLLFHCAGTPFLFALARELANVIGLPKIKSSSALSCPLVSRSLSFAPLPSRIYARRERRGLYKCERAKRSAHTKRNSSSLSVSLALLLFSLSVPLSVSRTANQTVLHESRPLKRIVFHARRVTD